MHVGVPEVLEQAARAPLSALEAARGEHLAGVTCCYAPLEVLHAAGLVPLRLRAPGRPAPVADSWLPSFTCPVVRGILGAALEGRLDRLATVVVPHACDSMQELAGIWRMLRPEASLLIPVGPVAVEGPRAAEYLRQELLAFAGRLGRPVGDEDLARSIALYNRLRRAVQRLDALRDRLPAAGAWAAIAAAWQMPPEDYVGIAEELIVRLEEAAPRPAEGPAVALVGSLLDEPLIPELIDSLGGRVVADDLCNGARDVGALADETGDPWSALAGRMLRRPPCPAQYAPAADRAGRLVELSARRGARGLVQVLVKFCDPHGFDAVPIGRALAAAGVGWLLMEVEATNAPEQLRTRLQAFLEVLANNVG